MAAGDLTDLIARVQTRGSFNTADTGLTTTVITGFINAALEQIASEHDWPWLYGTATFATVNGTDTYSPPADWLLTDLLSHADGTVFEERALDDITRMPTTPKAKPTSFTVYGDQIILRSVPDAVYTVTHRYMHGEKTLASGGDLPYIPSSVDEGVVEWATMLSFNFTRQYDKANDAAARYNAWLTATNVRMMRTQRPFRINVQTGGLADLTDLIGRVQSRGSFNTADGPLTVTILTGFINAALEQIASEHDWPWLFSTTTFPTVAGTTTYSVPADWLVTDSLSYADIGRKIDERSIDELDRYTATSTDRPAIFSIYGDQIELRPVPDTVYTVTHRYMHGEKTLTAGTDKPYIPPAFDLGVVWWATMLSVDFLQDRKEVKTRYDFYENRMNMQEVQARYLAWLKSTQRKVRRVRRPFRIQVRPGSGF